MVRTRLSDNQWFNSEIRREIRILNPLHKIAMGNQSNQPLQKYKSQRNKVNIRIKYAREQFLLRTNERVNSIHSKTSKSYWSLVKRLTKGSGNGYARRINRRISIWRWDNYRSSKPIYSCSIISISDSNRESPTVFLRTNAILSNIDVNVEDVKDILQTFQIGKACGDDDRSHQMLKATSEAICLPLSILFRYSLQTCKFPSEWKLARFMTFFFFKGRQKQSLRL